MLKNTNFKSELRNSTIMAFLIWCLCTFTAELLLTHFINHQNVADSIFNLRTVYQKLITAGPRELRQNYTALVVINPDEDDDYKQAVQDVRNPCGERGTRIALAKILNKIAKQNPSVIVIDKFFSIACKDDYEGTEQLKNTLKEIGLHTPIVIGMLAPYGTEHSGPVPVLEKSQLFPTSESDNINNIHQGIVNIDPDNRKLALTWLVKSDENAKAKEIDTLAFAAVKAYYQTQSGPSATEYPEVIKLSVLNKNPYISFIDPAKFELKIPAGKLMKSDSSENFPQLRGKIVIIGESGNQYDKHDSVFNSKMDGFILQANYIEAMLDQRYYESIPWLDYVIGFFVFVAVYAADKAPCSTRKLLTHLSIILVGTCLVIYSLVGLVGFYMNPVAISSLILVIVIMHHFFPNHHQPQQKENQELIK